MEKNNPLDNTPKFAFFYLLSLVALLFMALSTGMVVFQIINKFIPEAAGFHSGSYSSGPLRFAISALVVSIPVFYAVTSRIYKALYSGDLEPDAAIRRWLTYLILLVTSVVMIIWVIMTVNSFLDGELTLKFALKFLTVLIIAGTVFGFYLYDIKRENIRGEKDPVTRIFFWASLIAVLGVFVSGLLVVESPWEARAKRLDQQVLQDLSYLNSQIDRYYKEEEALPADLEQLTESSLYRVSDEDMTDPETGERYEYEVTGEKEYRLCADFRTSGQDEDNYYLNREWPYEEGYNCFDLEVSPEEEPRAIPK